MHQSTPNHIPEAPERTFLFDSLRVFVSRSRLLKTWSGARTLERLNWDVILGHAERERVLPFVALALAREEMTGGLARDVQIRLKKGLDDAAAENMFRYHQFQKINALLAENRIRVILLKGIALTHSVYREMAIRGMRDLDFLIPETDLKKVQRLFAGASIRAKEGANAWQDDIVRRLRGKCHYTKEGLNVDLQWRPKFLIGGEKIPWAVEGVWKRARPWPDVAGNVWRLTAADEVQHLLLQMASDWEERRLRLLQFLDLALVWRDARAKGEKDLARVAMGSLGPVAPDARGKIAALAEAAEEFFFGRKRAAEFSGSARVLADFLFDGTREPLPDQEEFFAGRAIFEAALSWRDKCTLAAGYFFPGRRYLNETYGGLFGGPALHYMRHLFRLLSKACRLVARTLGISRKK